jgi:hypothetical protein
MQNYKSCFNSFNNKINHNKICDKFENFWIGGTVNDDNNLRIECE